MDWIGVVSNPLLGIVLMLLAALCGYLAWSRTPRDR